MKHPEPDLLATLAPARASPQPTPRRARLRRVALRTLAALLLLTFALHLAANLVLNHSVRPRLEQAVATRLPGATLQLRALRYEFWRDRLRCESLQLTLPGRAPLTTGAIALAGVHWSGLRADQPDPARILRDARLDIADVAALSVPLFSGDYQLRCAHLHLSIPAAELTARALALQPTVDDEAFFAADTFRRVRYRATIAAVTLRDIAFPELFRREAYRADSLEVHAPEFETYINREKPRRPPTRIPPMPHEALAGLDQPLRLGRLTITEGTIRLKARRAADAEPGILTFAAFALTARDIANLPAGGQTIQLQAQTRLMDAAPLTVDMSIPVAPAALTFDYSGKLGPMDLTRLNAYLSGTGSFEIKSGRAEGAEFSVAVVDGRARGTLQGIYRDLHVTVLDRETGNDDGLTTRVATVLANQIKVRHDNAPDRTGALAEGKIDYTRTPEDSFLHFSWAALRTGLSDLLTVL